MNTRKILSWLILSGMPFSQAFSQTHDVESIISKYGVITAKNQLSVGGLTAWTVEKSGTSIVLYTTNTPDQDLAVIAGQVWDPSGRPVISYPVMHSEQSGGQVSRTAVDARKSAMEGEFLGDIPEAMRTVDALAGFKEGKGGVADTVYVIIDPRCPYCQQAYQMTRSYVAQGASIKWIPTAALGNAESGMPLAATLLLNDPEKSDQVLSHKAQIRTELTAEMRQALDLNLAFMFAAFEQNGGQAGVPVAFYIDHRTGKPQMMTGLTDPIVLTDIFGK